MLIMSTKWNKYFIRKKEIKNMKKENEKCKKTCTCGCQEGKKCTCGCEEEKCTCDKNCTCGCQEGKKCTCEEKKHKCKCHNSK